MNRYQNVVVIIATANLLLMLLFPPFLDNPIGRGVPAGFDSFRLVFDGPPGGRIYEEMLTIEVIFVLANALAAWLVLNSKDGREPRPDDRQINRGLLIFAGIDFLLIGLFPPFQPYMSIVRPMPEGFDSFYFALGDKRHRDIFLPMLYLEILLVAADLLVAWLLFGLLRPALSATEQRLIAAAQQMPPEQVEQFIHGSAASGSHGHELGRHEDRRHHQDPAFPGPERRHEQDRRHHRP